MKFLDRLFGRGAPTAGPTPEAPAARYHSRFGGLWIDRLDADRLLEQKAAADPRYARWKDTIARFMADGYVIIEGAVPHAAIDAYLRDLADDRAARERLMVSVPINSPADKDVIPLEQADMRIPLTKLLDSYFHLPSALAISFAPPVREFLSLVFEDDVLAFQGLHFECGSTQAIHQDTAYVVVSEPMRLCASWAALEDIQPGSGELIYYRGSHRLPDWIYSDRFKHYNHQRDPHDQHVDHLQALHDRSADRGLPLETFRPKKGDVLIWAADLAHGGGPITDTALSRRSLVTHYCPNHCTPHYFGFVSPKRQVRFPHQPGAFYSSMYYER